MAQLPLIRERSVDPSGQTPGYQRVQYDPQAFGAGIGRALGQTGETLSAVAEIERGLQDQVKANDALNWTQQAEDELRSVMYDPRDGMIAQSGGNAMGVGQMTAAHTEAIRKKYMDKIEDPQVKTAFERVWARSAEQAKDTAARHELTQSSVYRVETSKAVLAGSITDAYNAFNDEKAISKAIEDAHTAIDVNSEGVPPEGLALAKAEATSTVHLAALSRWATEDPHKALAYYEKHKDKFSGKDHVTATSFIESARQDRRSDEHFARITGVGGATQQVYDAIIFAESRGDPTAESPTGASGLMQVQPDTARMVARQIQRLDVAELPDAELKALLKSDTELNKQLGQKYFDDQMTAFGGDIEAALVAYNAGPKAAKAFLAHNAGRRPLDRDYDVPGWKGIKNETEGYVQTVLGRLGIGDAPGSRMTRDNWTLRNFTPDQLMAPTEAGAWVNAQAANQLDLLADRMKAQFPGFEIKINEEHSFDPAKGTAGRRRGTSDPGDNPHVKNSQHLHGTAFDVQVQGWNDVQKAAFLAQARALGFGGIGFYGPDGHLHIDMGTPRTWGRVPEWARNAMLVPVAKGIQGGGPGQPGFGGTGGTGFTQGQQGSPYARPKAFDLPSALEAANAIIDPGERERTVSKIRVEHAKQEAAIEAQELATKQDAWNTVVAGGVKDLTAIQISQLEPSFVNSLYTYEENRAKGIFPMDYEAWSQFPTDPKVLSKLDVWTEWRNKLDNPHFERALELKRQAIESLRGDASATKALANMRTRQQIIEDSMLAIDDTPSKQTTAQLTRAVEERIIAEQDPEKPLTAEDIQDIVDKLLISDKEWGWTSPSAQGPAFGAEDPATFTAAGEWEDVDPTDQEVLVNQFRNLYGQDPDRERATDIYNRAFRVFLGATPEIPEDELPALDEALTRTYGRPPSEKDRQDAYRSYLLGFLGRR